MKREPKPELTGKQSLIYAWIKNFQKTHGYPPTVRELASSFSFANASGAQCHLTAMRQKGYVTWEKGKSRTLKAVGDL